MDYQIAVPSYKRADVCVKATLSTLKRHGADFDRVTVFTATEAETELYQQAIAAAGLRPNVVMGVPGLCRQRVLISKYYDEGTPILSLDDDVFSLHAVDKDKTLHPFEGDLSRLAAKGFELCRRTKARLWGIYPVSNGYFMHQTISIGLRYIEGAFFGSFAGDPVWTGDDRKMLSSGEDFENTLRSFALYKGVIRFDGVCFKTRYFAPGGMESELGGKANRMADHETQLRRIASEHSKLAKVYRKSNGTLNIKLRPITHQKLKWQ